MEHNTQPLMIGTLVQLKRECLDNQEGTIGVVYEVYERATRRDDGQDRYGISVIFPNGRHDGFSSSERNMLLTVIGITTARPVRLYQVKHVTQLMLDFERGLFTQAFAEGVLLKTGAL